MDDISNRTLAILLVTAIVISLGSSVYVLNTLQNANQILPVTGFANSDQGNVTLEVLNQVSIILTDSVIDFGTGSVNTSCTFATTNSYANLSTSDAGLVDQTDCWTGSPSVGDTDPFILENNGNLNASVSLRGPTNATFFNNYAGAYNYGIQMKSRDKTGESNSCEGGTGLVTTWTDLSDNATICSHLNWDPSTTDELAIDINVRVPTDLPTGVYQNETIEFYAVQS